MKKHIKFLVVLIFGASPLWSDSDPPAIPTLISPEDSTWINDNTPTLIYSSVGELLVTYRLQYTVDQTFASGITTIPGLTDTFYTIPSPVTDTTFYWRVKAIDSVGNESNYQASPFRFSVDSKKTGGSCPSFP